MHKSIAIILATIAVLLTAIAFAPGMAAATVKTGHIGDRLRLRGSEMTYNTADVTVWKVARNPVKDRFGVRLTFRNVRTKYNKYTDWQDSIANCVRLTDANGRKMPVIPAPTLIGPEDEISLIHLDIGESVRGWVYFRLKPHQVAKTFQFKVNGRFGYDTGRWSLR